jgi:hypothetical protein
LAAGSTSAADWQRHVVTHYHDHTLEGVRRSLAKLCIDRAGGKEWSDSELEAFQHWSRALGDQP